MHLQYRIRMTGENGLAQAIIFFSNILETWNSKLNTFAYNSGKLNDGEWQAFYAQMDEWFESMNKALSFVGKPTKDGDELGGDKEKPTTKRV